MTLYEGGRVRYRLRFLTRPELDSNSFASDYVYEADMDFNMPELEGEWKVADVLLAPEGEPDMLNIAPKR